MYKKLYYVERINNFKFIMQDVYIKDFNIIQNLMLVI